MLRGGTRGWRTWLCSGRGGCLGEPAQIVDHHGMAAVANLQLLPATASASPAAIPVVVKQISRATWCWT